MRLVIASNNMKKRQEIARLFELDKLCILSVEETVSIDVVEDGDTFASNAQKKAQQFAQANGCAALADDSGLCVDALAGAPGIYSARFAGEACDDAANNSYLLQKLADCERRTAFFVCHLCIAWPDSAQVLHAEGRVEGEILRVFEGQKGFGYDPLFYSPELGKTFACATAEEKASISHRGRALRQMLPQLQQHMISNHE